MSVFDTLVYDRTLEDVQQVLNGVDNAKGAYNAEDLNRVCSAVNILSSALTKAGYSFGYTSLKTDWTFSDGVTVNELYSVLESIKSFVTFIYIEFSHYAETPPPPETLAPIDWEKANAVEKILLDVNILAEKMIAGFYYLNELYLGEV